VLGLGTMATIVGELGLLSDTLRGHLIRHAGHALIAGRPAERDP